MNNLQVSAILKIHDGKLNELKALAPLIIETIKAKEPGTIQFDWFFNADETECVLRETYRDSAAMLAHFDISGALVGKILEVSDMKLEIYGNPSQELRKVLARSNPKIYSFYQGL